MYEGFATGRIFRDRKDEDMEGLGLKIGDYSFRHPLRGYAKVIMKFDVFPRISGATQLGDKNPVPVGCGACGGCTKPRSDPHEPS